MRVSQFDFKLPEDLIALRPAAPRDTARCLVVRSGGVLEDRRMRDLPALLGQGDLLVFNDTRVIPAALTGHRRGRHGGVARIHFTLHQPAGPDSWRAFARPLKRLQAGDKITFSDGFTAQVQEISKTGDVALQFNLAGEALDAAIARHGETPLPPYIAGRRAVDAQDRADYQTVFARVSGSVAAPTAALHFTPELVSRLEEAGIKHCFITLHVGAGTFLPVKTEDTDAHHMHGEWGAIPAASAALINAAHAEGRRVIAVGTTSLRLLESAASEDGKVSPWSGETRIFITPGYKFRVADALISNFHLPKSTLFMLVSAFCGLEVMKKAYDHAISSGYRFYSYGDGSLLFRSPA